ncbi:MAG TPA: hypothetical protein PKO15_01670 [Fibrobacteria bacterium]|nr:hypothetical protein [Fibrobacteria bacterium]HOX49859.1 hypothetical protein [Fibrobacteria bacterium]
MKHIIASFLAISATAWSQDIQSSLRVLKDGTAGVSTYNGSEKTLAVTDEPSNLSSIAWMAFPPVDLSSPRSLHLEVFVREVTQPGTLQVRRLTSPVSSPEQNTPLAGIAYDASSTLATIPLSQGNRLVRIDLAALAANPSFHGLALTSSDGLKARLDSKEGGFGPALVLGYPLGTNGMSFKGEWSSLTSYAANDAVTFSGAMYVAVDSVLGATPNDIRHWTLAVAKGTDGRDGASGPTGPQGAQGPQGERGLQGFQGPKGDSGAMGPQGPQGPQGEKGDPGPSGTLASGSVLRAHLAQSTVDSLYETFLSRLVARHQIGQMAGGAEFSLFLTSDGRVYGAGDNTFGQYGNSTNRNSTVPVLVRNAGDPLTRIRQIAVGSRHSLFLEADGTVLATGWNTYGQLGDSTRVDRLSVQRVAKRGATIQNVRKVAAGRYQSFLILSDSTLMISGRNNVGQAGTGDSLDLVEWTSARSEGVLVDKAADACGGTSFSLVLRGDGTALAAGDNSAGQLGTGGVSSPRFAPVPLTGIRSIACGFTHSLFLLADSSVWATGSNQFGQLGTGTRDPRFQPIKVADSVVSIWAGGDASFIGMADGTLRATGYNLDGGLGVGDTLHHDVWLPVLKAGQPITEVKSVGAGYWHSIVLQHDSWIGATGNNWDGEFGNGTVGVVNSLKGLPIAP